MRVSDTWVGAIIGTIGILGGLIGQALYWGMFKGSVLERFNNQRKDIDRHEERLDQHGHEITRLGTRVAIVERTCQINHEGER